MTRSVVLLSGGLDSATALAMAKADGRELHALTVDYGQRHKKEVAAAKKLAKHFGIKDHKVLKLNLAAFGGSALTDTAMAIPENRTAAQIGTDIPSTYVPARNMVLLSVALAYAETLDADEVVIAAHAADSSGYPDCRPGFLAVFQEVARLGTKRGAEGRPIHIRAPLIRMRKVEIVRKAKELGVPLELTWSCYAGGAKACGVCDSCQLRLKGFREAGIEDPIPYETRKD